MYSSLYALEGLCGWSTKEKQSICNPTVERFCSLKRSRSFSEWYTILHLQYNLSLSSYVMLYLWLGVQRGQRFKTVSHLFSHEAVSMSMLWERDRDWDWVSRLLDGELERELTPSLLWLRYATPIVMESTKGSTVFEYKPADCVMEKKKG